MTAKSSKFSLPSLVKATRTRTNKFNRRTAARGILPGGGHGSHSTSSIWSPYARPPRRSKKLVLLSICIFLTIAILTWYIVARHTSLANSPGNILIEEPPQQMVMDE